LAAFFVSAVAEREKRSLGGNSECYHLARRADAEDGQVHFAESCVLIREDLAAVQQQVHARVLRWFARAGHRDAVDARDMAG
jgi:hypothetical protein